MIKLFNYLARSTWRKEYGKVVFWFRVSHIVCGRLKYALEGKPMFASFRKIFDYIKLGYGF